MTLRFFDHTHSLYTHSIAIMPRLVYNNVYIVYHFTDHAWLYVAWHLPGLTTSLVHGMNMQTKCQTMHIYIHQIDPTCMTNLWAVTWLWGNAACIIIIIMLHQRHTIQVLIVSYTCVTCVIIYVLVRSWAWGIYGLSLIHIWRCRRIERCRSRWSPYH